MTNRPSQSTDGTSNTSRRGFLKAPLAAGAAGALLYAGYTRNSATGEGDRSTRKRSAGIDEHDPANIKLATVLSDRVTDDQMLFFKQLGMRWVSVNFNMQTATLDHMAAVQKRFAAHDIQIHSGIHYAYRNLKVQLGLPGRDEFIDQYCAFLRNLGKLGIGFACYDFHPANTYTTSHVTRRGYVAREFDLKVFREKIEKQAFDREYPADEMWGYYTDFMKAVLPVAEEADVRLALHPDDPPIAKMNGVAKLFTHYEGYRRAEEIAGGSRHWGLTFCVGTWMEGGGQMGKDVFEMIGDFGGRGKILTVHFRNVSSPLPHFVETFLDDGYTDMFEVMKGLRQVGYNGTIVPDHIPQMAGDEGIRPAGQAYCLSYMRALLRRANEEVG